MKALLVALSLCFCTAALAQEQYVTIDALPIGEPPLWVREAWVGLQVPFKDRAVCSAGILTSASTTPRPGVNVSQQVAIEYLRRKSPAAAEWWERSGFPQQGLHFCFVTEPLVSSLFPERYIM